mmetsp:Transcript_43916/g.82042  ORF Transcript_43916/g.82042 Transcript_43916/m.82042 type:complete len:421 (-) Transcript_43916:21-1283(-)
MMTVRPVQVEDWFGLVPDLLSQKSWRPVLQMGDSAISCRNCPWGGHLVKFTYQDLHVWPVPEDPSLLLPGPEARAQWLATHSGPDDEKFRVVDLIEPGCANVQRWASWRFFKLCTIFFGRLSHQLVQSYFFQPDKPGDFQQRRRRNYPEVGDSILTWRSLEEPWEACVHTRPVPSGGAFDASMVLSFPQGGLDSWDPGHLSQLLGSCRDLLIWFVTRPGITEMRAADAGFYVVLTIQSWRRGRPLVPVRDGEGTIKIDSGRDLGLTEWDRYHPRLVGSTRFHLSDYLMLFASRMGETLTAHDSLDGQELLPYQCAVSASEWRAVGDRISRAYLLQKIAYRHAGGGSAAPAISENVPPRFCRDQSLEKLQERQQTAQQNARIVVKNTFVEVADEEEEEEVDLHCKLRPRTVSPLRRVCLVA